MRLKKLAVILQVALLFIMLLAASPMQSMDAAPGSMSKQRAYQLLKAGDSAAVRSLATGDREILLAKLALDAGHAEEAIQILSSRSVEKNPLAALIRAEAYRLQAVAAAKRAGHYAHAVTGDIGKLQHARLNIGLDQAEARLQTFMGYTGSRPVHLAARSTHAALPDSLRQAIDAWRTDWESRNGDAYLSHYHPNFKTKKHDFASWSAYKRRVNSRKKYIKVKLSDLKLLRGPEQIAEGEAILVAFKQKYESSNYAANSRKQLYLVRRNADSQWLILYEGEASRPYHRNKVKTASQLSLNSKNVLKAAKTGSWAINLGSFDSAANAEQMASGIQLNGDQQPFVSSALVRGKAVHRVRIGLYRNRGEAVEAMVKICPELSLTDCWLEQLNK